LGFAWACACLVHILIARTPHRQPITFDLVVDDNLINQRWRNACSGNSNCAENGVEAVKIMEEGDYDLLPDA